MTELESEYDLEKYSSIILHNTQVNNLEGLPRSKLLFLREINLSSNNLRNSTNLAPLQYLYSLVSLDLSTNQIDSLVLFPYLQGLEVLKVPYNSIKEIPEDFHRSVPSLTTLDIRVNQLANGASIVALRNLSQLKVLLIGGVQEFVSPNPVCANPSTIAKLFQICPTLQSIDKKNKEVWLHGEMSAQASYAATTAAAYALQQQQQQHAQPTFTGLSASAPAAVVETPHFDRMRAKFILQKGKQQEMFSPPHQQQQQQQTYALPQPPPPPISQQLQLLQNYSPPGKYDMFPKLQQLFIFISICNINSWIHPNHICREP